MLRISLKLLVVAFLGLLISCESNTATQEGGESNESSAEATSGSSPDFEKFVSLFAAAPSSPSYDEDWMYEFMDKGGTEISEEFAAHYIHGQKVKNHKLGFGNDAEVKELDATRKYTPVEQLNIDGNTAIIFSWMDKDGTETYLCTYKDGQYIDGIVVQAYYTKLDDDGLDMFFTREGGVPSGNHHKLMISEAIPGVGTPMYNYNISPEGKIILDEK